MKERQTSKRKDCWTSLRWEWFEILRQKLLKSFHKKLSLDRSRHSWSQNIPTNSVQNNFLWESSQLSARLLTETHRWRTLQEISSYRATNLSAVRHLHSPLLWDLCQSQNLLMSSSSCSCCLPNSLFSAEQFAYIFISYLNETFGIILGGLSTWFFLVVFNTAVIVV